MLDLKVKKLHKDAKIPTKAYDNDAGFDLYSVEDCVLKNGQTIKIHTGIALGIPEGHCCYIVDRSSMGSKGFVKFAGLIDEAYTGEILVCMSNVNFPAAHNTHWGFFEKFVPDVYQITKGQKIAQFIVLPVPEVQIVEVEALDETDRKHQGFGSSGK